MDRVVIFGASRGLGAALRQHVEQQGVAVAGWSRRNGDLSREEGQVSALEFLLSEPVSKVFCVAGGGPYGLFHRHAWSSHQWAWQVTFAFPARVLHTLAGRPQKQQVILIGSSVAEAAADPNAASYCAAKHALRGLFYTVKSEYPDWDVRLFSPGYIDTELLPKNAPVRRAGVYDPAVLAGQLWSWTLTNDPSGHKMYAKHPTWSPKLSDKKIENVIIIGSGPAGLTAALYTARANLAPFMIEGYETGGQLMTTTEVENYPGFEHGIQGPELMQIMRKQVERFGTRFLTRNVTKVDFSKRPFKVWVESELYEAHTIIISTGATAKYLGLENEKRLLGRGVSACATCDGAFFKNQSVAVIGGGDTAMEEANFLTRFASKVHVIHRRHEFRASKIMADRVLKNPKIEVIWNSEMVDVLGDKGVKGIKLKNLETGKESTLDVEGVFVAIGHKPNTDLFKGVLKMNEVGYLITKEKSTYTSVEGVFAAGDVADPIYRQAVTAAGTGCMAAIDAERWLENQGHK